MRNLKMSDFYLVLPSNSQIDNLPSHFNTELEKPIDLQDASQWCVGLIEFSFRNSLKTIQEHDFIKVTQRVPNKSYSLIAKASRLDGPSSINDNHNRAFLNSHLRIDSKQLLSRELHCRADNFDCDNHTNKKKDYKDHILLESGKNDPIPFKFEMVQQKVQLEVATTKLNAKITIPASIAQDFGFIAVILDTEGNRVALHSVS